MIKVPDALPEQAGFEGLFLPTYGFSMERGPYSRFPDALDPVLSLLPYRGDLGLDTGEPQSVYEFDKDKLDVFEKDTGADFRLDIALGQTKQLPNGAGSITFDGVDRWKVRLQVSDSPGKRIALGGVLLAITGLLGSLFIRRAAPGCGCVRRAGVPWWRPDWTAAPAATWGTRSTSSRRLRERLAAGGSPRPRRQSRHHRHQPGRSSREHG